MLRVILGLTFALFSAAGEAATISGLSRQQVYTFSATNITGTVSGFANGACSVTVAGQTTTSCAVSDGTVSFNTPSIATIQCTDLVIEQTTPTAVSATWTLADRGGFCFKAGFSEFGLRSPLGTAVHGQAVPFSVVAQNSMSLVPVGEVSLYRGTNCTGTFLGYVPINAGNSPVVLTTSSTITAYFPGDDNFRDVCSTATILGHTNFTVGDDTYYDQLTIPVGPANTTNTLTANRTRALLGSEIVLTSTIAVEAPGAGDPVGTVRFSEVSTSTTTLCNNVVVSGGTATCTVDSFGLGPHTIQASFLAGADFNGSVQNEDLIVRIVDTAVVDFNSNAASAVAGSEVALTAVVTGSGETPTGNVHFYNETDTELEGSPVALTSGQAVLTIATLPVGVHQLYVIYEGDDHYAETDKKFFEQTITANPGGTSGGTSGGTTSSTAGSTTGGAAGGGTGGTTSSSGAATGGALSSKKGGCQSHDAPLALVFVAAFALVRRR